MKTNYPDSLTIQQYLEGKLDPEVMHQLEKQALDDPFLWDALEGYATHTDPAADLSILQRQLHERIVHLQENKKVFDLSWQRLSVAAAAAVMFVSAGILFWMNSPKPDDRLASQVQKPVEVSVIDRDSVEAVIKAKDEQVIASLEKEEMVPEKPTVSAYKSVEPGERKAVFSPKAENEIAGKQDIATGSETETRTMVASSAPLAARQARKAEMGKDAALNEVVVTAYGHQPKSGWQAYREYIDLNTKKFKTEPAMKGSVLLSFQVNSNGKLTNIKVVKSLNEAYDKEAIRIVKAGVDWTPSADGKTSEMTFEVNF